MPRPIEGHERKTMFSFSSEPDVIKQFDEVAHKERKSRSALLTYLIIEYVKAHGSGNPNYKLTQFPEVKAWPTPWDGKRFMSFDFSDYSSEDLASMEILLRQGIVAVRDAVKANRK